MTEIEKRIRSEIVRKMRKKLTSGASWRESSGRKRLPIRRLAQLGFCSCMICSLSRFEPSINLGIMVYVLNRD